LRQVLNLLASLERKSASAWQSSRLFGEESPIAALVIHALKSILALSKTNELSQNSLLRTLCQICDVLQLMASEESGWAIATQGLKTLLQD